MGITSTTESPGRIRSRTSGFSSCPKTAIRPSVSLRLSIPSPVLALIQRTGASSVTVVRRSFGTRSALLNASKKGIFFFLIRSMSSVSSAPKPFVPSITTTAASVLFNVCRLFFTRRLPSCPVSSSPGVSSITTGPMGRSSMAFCTGSVVVPPMGETTERS